jgi:hypothetical protein
MVGKNQMYPLAYKKLGAVFKKTTFFDIVYFFHQGVDVENHAVADDAEFVLPQAPAGDLVENDLFVTYYHRVAGIAAALKTNHCVGEFGKDVNYFTLSFVSPLGADYHDTCHNGSSRPPRRLAGNGSSV